MFIYSAFKLVVGIIPLAIFGAVLSFSLLTPYDHGIGIPLAYILQGDGLRAKMIDEAPI
jgi:hypothetical protein